MRRWPNYPLTLALILTATSTACIADWTKTASLARALREQYPTARVDIGFMYGGTHHLVVTVDDSSKRRLSEGVPLQREADENTTGPASFVAVDPDGNPILVDQHV